MFDNATRSLWLEEQVWPRVRKAFGITSIPENIMVTVGFPSSGARGQSAKMKVAEYNTQWQGNQNEQGMFSIHPASFKTPEQIVGSLAFAACKATKGARWGAIHSGLSKDDSGTILFEPMAKLKIDAIINEMGEPPSGYGVPFPVRQVNRTRMRRYVASDVMCADGTTKHPVHRVASDTDSFLCATCGTAYKLG